MIKTQPPNQLFTVPWKSCFLCKNDTFKSPKEFLVHLKIQHCRKEGGSYVCTYGYNSICQSLPLEGVSEKDYDMHASRFHVSPDANKYSIVESKLLSTGDTFLKTKDEFNSNSRRLSADAEQLGKERVASNTASGRWTVYNAKVNLAALLNDPRPGKRQPDFFTKTWGVGWDYLDLSPIVEIPEITPQHFRKYKKIILPKLAAHQKHVSNNSDNELPIDAFPKLYTRAHDKATTELEKVPSLYYTPSFDLSDERLFNRVFPWSQIESSQARSKRLLQEQMTHYLDTIEVQIARQVALKSEAFFHVLASHEDLQARLAESHKSVGLLRAKFKGMKESNVCVPLRMLAKTRKKQRLCFIARKMKLMSTLQQTQPTVQQLLSSNDFVGALDIINTAQEVLNKELAGIQSFRHLGSQLLELEKAITQMANQEFMTYIAQYLNKPIKEGCEEIDEDRFTAVYMGLLRLSSTDFIDTYRNEIVTTIKAIVKQTVVQYVSAADKFGADLSNLGDQMRTLNFTSWLLLMEDIFSNLLVILQRIKSLIDLMKYLTQEAAGVADEIIDSGIISNGSDNHRHSIVSSHISGQSIITEMLCEKINKELRDLLHKACEHANDRCSKVINARSKDGYIEKLTPHEFFSLASSVEKFSRSCDQLCGGKVINHSLRGCLQGYNIRFINRFHDDRKSRLNLLLDHERWKQSDVPRDLQACITHCDLCEQLTLSDEIKPENGPPHPTVTVGGHSFTIVGTAVTLTKMILEYCSCLEDLPKAAPDILIKLVEILKTFNSRSSQLVLGAGALQLVGLKTISARNLALLQRSLELVLFYIPKISKQFSVYLNEPKSSMLRHFDTLTDDYKHHIRVVSEKLRGVAYGMIESCTSHWELRAPMPSNCFRTLCKQINRFYETICDVLEAQQLQQLFSDVNAKLKAALKERLKSLNITILTGPQQGLIMADLAYFNQNASTLKSSQPELTITLSLTLNDIIISR